MNNAKLKIVLLGRFNPAEVLSGPEKVAKRLFQNLPEDSCRVEFLTYFFDGNRFSPFQKLFGMKEIAEFQGRKVTALGFFRLPFFLLKTKPDIIHFITYERFYLLSLLLKKYLASKFVYTAHGLIQYENLRLGRPVSFLYRFKDILCERAYFRLTDVAVFVSAAFRAFCTREFHGRIYNHSVIHNGVDEIFSAHGAVRKTSSGILRICFVADPGRTEKGYKYFIEAVELVTTPLEITIVTDNHEFLPRVNGNHSVKKQANMRTEEYAEFLSGQDVLVLPSTYEPFSIVAFEAMAAGAVPVVSRDSGIAELIEDGVDGFVFTAGDRTVLAALLTRLSLNRTLLEATANAGREKAEQFSWEAISNLYVREYKKILETE